MRGSATETMLAHRYGATASTTPAQPQRSRGVPTAAEAAAAAQGKHLSSRETAYHRAAVELRQHLENAGLSVPGAIARGWSSFEFGAPVDQISQQIGPTALQISSRHGAPVTILQSWKKGYPETVIVIGDAAGAHALYQTPYAKLT